MDLYRAFLAIVLSFLILIGYQYFFVKPAPQQPPVAVQSQQVTEASGQQALPASAAATATINARQSVPADPHAKDIAIDTPLYTAVINEQGGGFKTFVLIIIAPRWIRNPGRCN